MTQSEAPPPLLRLVVTEGPQAGKALDSSKGTSLRVGRTAKSALYIKDPTISEAHAEVAWREGAWRVRDLGSSNGTALNGRALEEGAWEALKDGDTLKLGTDTLARVEVAAVASDELTVEQFVLAECAQLEQRIRWGRAGEWGELGGACGEPGARRRLLRAAGSAATAAASCRSGWGSAPAAEAGGSCIPRWCASRPGQPARLSSIADSRPLFLLPSPPRTCRARAEQAANQLRQEWQEQKQALLMG